MALPVRERRPPVGTTRRRRAESRIAKHWDGSCLGTVLIPGVDAPARERRPQSVLPMDSPREGRRKERVLKVERVVAAFGCGKAANPLGLRPFRFFRRRGSASPLACWAGGWVATGMAVGSCGKGEKRVREHREQEGGGGGRHRAGARSQAPTTLRYANVSLAPAPNPGWCVRPSLPTKPAVPLHDGGVCRTTRAWGFVAGESTARHAGLRSAPR